VTDAEAKLALLDKIDDRRKRADTKALDISLNELADMYADGELEIRPEYQRMFRWDESKQSQFVESLLLEMPIPPIFVIELEEGKWELIDGLQRISTYLHFRGLLEASEIERPIHKGDSLVLEECDIVEELNGKKYDDLPAPLQIRLKRSFLGVQVIRKETDKRFRYYMFKRLNTGGEPLSPQEIRNCTIRLLGSTFNDFIVELSKEPGFKVCIEPLTNDKRMKMLDVELVLRFFSFKNNFAGFRHDISPFLDAFMERVTDQERPDAMTFDYAVERDRFQRVFKILSETLGGNTCLRWLNDKAGFGGEFSLHHFEAFALGVAKVSDATPSPPNVDAIGAALLQVKKDAEFRQLTTGGGQNSPGPYRKKIDYVADRVRQAW
jgi:hypothetical protein